MSDTTAPKSNPDQGSEALDRALEYGIRFELARRRGDHVAMRTALANLINLHHNATADQAAGATYSVDKLAETFVYGGLAVMLMRRLDVVRATLSLELTNVMAAFMPSPLTWFNASHTGACVDDRVSEPTSSEGEPGSGS